MNKEIEISPRQIAKAINNLLNEKEKLEQENKELHNKIDKTIEVLDEILVYDDFSDITQGFGNVKEELKFYLSECETLKEFRKKDSDVDE